MDSVLGIHSGDLAKFRATADLKSSSTLNFAKSPTSNTAIPRILEKENQCECEKSASPSLRDTAKDSALGKHSADFGGLEATADHQSSSAPKPPKNYESPTANPRIFEEEHCAECEKSCREQVELESTFSMDSACGLESWIAARVLRLLSPSMRPYTRLQSPNSSSTILESQDPLKSPTNLESTFEKVDSSPKAESPQARADLDSRKSLSDSKILDEKCGLQGKSQGSYLDGDLCDFSPLPHLSSKAQSPQVDSSNDYSVQAKSKINGARKARNLESVQGDWGGQKE